MTAPSAPNKQQVDEESLEGQVKEMYRKVADEPDGEFHFEMGRGLAEKLGYPADDLDRIPADSIKSFAGVGYYFHLADLKDGENVLDLGSGSGTDTFIAARKVGPEGTVTGIDMTDEQLAKANRLCGEAGFSNVTYRKGYINEVSLPDGSIDAVISNGVINLVPDKGSVFREVARVLRPGGRLALSDIVTESQLPDTVSCNADLWAACIGGAMQEDDYRSTIEAAGLEVTQVEPCPYEFISDNAKGAAENWGVKSIALLAVKPA